MKISFCSILALFTFLPLSAELIEITSVNQFNNLLHKKKYLVIKFSANYCPPCKLTKKPFEKIANEEEFKNIVFTEIDIQAPTGEELSTKYKILGVPTFVFIENGEEIEKIVGLDQPAHFTEDFKTKIRKIFAKMPQEKEPKKANDIMKIKIEKEEEVITQEPTEEQKTEIPQQNQSFLYQLRLSMQALFIFILDKMKELITYIINLIKGIFGK